MTTTITPGFLVLHGNRAELLGEAVFEWLRRQPLGPLEEEIFLVQSNGVAEWLKMTLAEANGICAATRVELPGRFLWRSYRQLLGREAVPAQSRLDKLPLTWSLMRLLPDLLDRPVFEPLAGFLRLGGMERRLQLASALADLFDQYQVYRSDWLEAWGQGRDVLPRLVGESADAAMALPPDQAWQAALWRELLVPLNPAERAGSRPQLHQRFVAAVQGGQAPISPLARRVILFGMSHVPMQTLQALAALSEHCQVVLAIPNPCRYHWADIMDGRELLRSERRRQPLRQGVDLAALSLEDMHAHAHPLLASWGRQGRDFVRQLDQFDDVSQAQERFQVSKIDLFDEAPGDSLLSQVQAHIRDLLPLAEHPRPALAAADRSIVFHIAHSAQREVEILHDQLLTLLAEAEGALAPRDIVVMVPDIESFAPAIRSVFGQFGFGARSSDKRFIPYDIADLKERANNPLAVALEWLLRLPQQRCRLSELQALLEVPAIAARFGLAPEDLPRLNQWMAGAGIRWGLDAAQRADMGLAACGEQNSLVFGLRRILLGYGAGEGPAFQGIQPYAEVGGLSAGLAGSLADLAAALDAWWAGVATPATPAVWAERCRQLMSDFFAASHEVESLTLAAAAAALNSWLEVCALAGFEAEIELAVVREAWLEGLDAPTLNRRFKAGGVTFCSLMPMRAVPFEVVCLLGMNDGDYPRRASRNDFDLMGLAGLARPGDRSRRDDDRQLMLEALLSARAKLYISWSGRSVRDNSEQPPSVLVSQLRDYLSSGWGEAVLKPLTTEHPLQPFSRRYFETADGLFTHAREWRDAHVAQALEPGLAIPVSAEAPPLLSVSALLAFLRNPVKAFFKQRLLVQFDSQELSAEDDEAFSVAGLQEYVILRELLDELLVGLEAAPDLPDRVAAYTARLRRAGRLPMAEQGLRVERKLVATLAPMLQAWLQLRAQYPLAAPKELLRYPFDAPLFEDWLADVQCQESGGQRVWFELTTSSLCLNEKARSVRPERVLEAWLRLLTASACGVALRGVLVGKDATVTLEPLPQAQAQALLGDLLAAWQEGMDSTGAPLPLALSTGLALVSGKGDMAVVYEGGAFRNAAEGDEPCLARLFPDFAALSADGRFERLAQRLYGPLYDWVQRSAKLDLHQEGLA
jgi:exodeoxyribonuclease V gamma subunit